MKFGSTLFLKLAVILMGIPVLTLSILGLPWLANHPASPEYAHALYPIIIGMYLSVIPFYVALYQAFRLLIYIDKNIAFSHFSVKSLMHIKYCAFTMGSLYAVLMPFVFLVAEKDDAPGLILFGMVPIFATMVIAFFSAVLQKLLKEAIDIKTEHDLTI